MATKRLDPEEPTLVESVAAKLDSRVRAVILVAIAGACIALAPIPFGQVGAAVLALIAFELGKRR